MTPLFRDRLLEALARVSQREEARALAAFQTDRGRPYDGGSDADWDALDKDYTAVEEAMNIVRSVQSG